MYYDIFGFVIVHTDSSSACVHQSPANTFWFKCQGLKGMIIKWCTIIQKYE